ncbi:hypothetical protein BGW42_003672 [Actinomortierella wolfii]|nr:hypothetical protein BGW42_003672 [Actinomortierella wolfii]
MVEDVRAIVRVDYSGNRCSITGASTAAFNTLRAGISSSPKTTLTKCLVPTGESIIVSTSIIRFMVPNKDMFYSISTSNFGTQDELVNGMQASVDNTTLTTLPADALEELTIIEAKVVDTEAAALVCSWSRYSIAEVPHIVCEYTVTNVFVIKPPPMSSEIAQRLFNKGLNPIRTNITATMVLRHPPRVSENTVSFNVSKIIEESAAATRYFASLGNNFIVDWAGSMLYIIFDTVETAKGYEYPTLLFYFLIGVIIICIIFCILSKRFVDGIYWDSLYITVSKEITGGVDGTKPRLHQFNPKTLVFDGKYHLVTPAMSPQHSMDNVSYHSPPTGSQDHLMAY